ncbi:hypothetical protein INR38_09425 [Delftia sp. SD018]|uniref:hypothetical protein n=1 Tax=Delftia sp. SD018 TaxID=2781389 RepID=UPI001A972F6D|nr:hypothetical protein [Delftia sp. SD018]MBO1034306.1 hypothetical protein [Delftia sp. SD018]
MSNSTEPVSLNPWREGEYWVYADAERMPKGGWAGFFRIDHHPEGQPLVKTVMSRRIVSHEGHKTADLARLHAISYGQQFIRSALGEV